jgi:hypothetical protein
MRTAPAPATRTERHHRLKGDLACGVHRGGRLIRRQIEVTVGGWYVLNTEHRTVWLDSNPWPTP